MDDFDYFDVESYVEELDSYDDGSTLFDDLDVSELEDEESE